MRLWEVWDAFKAGKPVKSDSQKVWMRWVEHDEDYGGPCILDENDCYETYFSIEVGWLDADDWEVVPEPKKFEAWVNLYADGRAIINGGLISTDPLKPSPKVVECRKIEWEVGE